MSTADHLDSQLLPMLEKSDRARINYILGERFVPYDLAEFLLQEIEDILLQDPSKRPKCMLISGGPGYGKSMIMDEATRLFSGRGGRIGSTGRRSVPFVSIILPPMIDIRPLYWRALSVLGIPYSMDDKPAQLHEQTLTGLIEAQTRLLRIDEIHNLLSTMGKLKDAVVALRDITNAGIAIVAAGTPLAQNVIDADEQLSNRFRRHPLGLWPFSDETGDFLLTLESRLPLRNASGLNEKPLMSQIIRLSGGHLGVIVTSIREAARDAIRDGSERIDTDGIKKSITRLMKETAWA